MGRAESESKEYLKDYLEGELDNKIKRLELKFDEDRPDDDYMPNMTARIGEIYISNGTPGDYVGALASRMADITMTRNRYINLFKKIKQQINDYIQQNNITKQQLHDHPKDLIELIADIIDPDRHEKKKKREIELMKELEEERQKDEELEELLNFFRP